VEVHGAKRAVHIVNGVVNQRLADIEQPKGNGWVPLEKGRIAFQIESAEVLYRNIEIRPLSPDDDQSPASPATDPSPSPDAAARPNDVGHLTVPAGFEIEVAAGAPLVHYPMMACLDDRGRLFISESDGINRESVPKILADRPHKILMLEDLNGDGRFDKSTVFAEGLVQANGAEWYDGALYVCSAPYVWRFRDVDGDGRSDEQVRVAGKFNFDGMSSAFHGPVFGPDGRIYWSGGQHGWALEQTLLQPESSAPSGAGGPDAELGGPWTRTAPGAFSSWPDGSDAENIGNGGIANPVETTFTEEGEVLGTISLLDYVDGQRRDAVVHWIDGAVYFVKEHNYAGLIRTGDDLVPFCYPGHVAPSGIARYRGDEFGADYRDNYFFAQFNTHKVCRLIVDRDGATFRGRIEEFLASANTDSHFTDVMEDADGSLLVLDTGGWFLHGCPASQIAKPNIYGAVYRIRRQGAAKVSDPRGRTLPWTNASDAELCSRFDDSRFAVRDRAVHELAKRGTTAVAELKNSLAGASPRERLLSVWALNRIKTSMARTAVREALVDQDASVCLAAIHSAGLWRDELATPQLIASLDSSEMAVRRQAATALGRLKAATAVPAILDAAAQPLDSFLEHAISLALIRIGRDAATSKGLESESPAVRRIALIALDQRESPLLTRRIVAQSMDSPDSALQRTALDILRSHPQWSDEIVVRLRDWFDDENPSAERRASICGVVQSFWQNESVQRMVADELVGNNAKGDRQLMLLEAIAAIDSEKLPQSWIESLKSCLGNPSPEIAAQSVVVISKHNSSEFEPFLRTIALSNDHPNSIRVAAAAVAARHQEQLSDELLGVLLNLCNEDTDTVDRVVAAQAIGGAQLNEVQLFRLADFLPIAGPLELPTLLRPFEHSRNQAVGLRLVETLSTAPDLSEVSSQQLARLLRIYPEAVTQRGQPLLSKLGVEQEDHASRLEMLCDQMTGGNPDSGRNVFFGMRASCSKCHQIRGEGGQVGPNLSQIAAIRTQRDLLEAVVFPSASFVRDFEPYLVVTANGKALDGFITRQTPQALFLRAADLSEIRVERSQIEELRPGNVSIMPQGLDKVLSPDELRDLISFLLTLK
jgi:putative membrane-bound dehydrogenase-like protein